MRRFLSAALLLALVVACGGAKPDAAVTGFFDAMKAGDGARAVSYMSQASIDEMGAGLEELKADTTGMAAAMLPMMGINVTPEQLQSMSTEDFVAALFSSQMIKDMFANASVTILSSEVNGDNAVVKVSTNMNGEISEENIELVREFDLVFGGVWKLDTPRPPAIPTTVTIVNGLDSYDIWYVYVSRTIDPWGDDRLGASTLAPGESIDVDITTGAWDMKVQDEDGDTYTLWGVDIPETGYYWAVTLDQMD